MKESLVNYLASVMSYQQNHNGNHKSRSLSSNVKNPKRQLQESMAAIMDKCYDNFSHKISSMKNYSLSSNTRIQKLESKLEGLNYSISDLSAHYEAKLSKVNDLVSFNQSKIDKLSVKNTKLEKALSKKTEE